jgi:uncharacterized protein (TIGR02246 family)
LLEVALKKPIIFKRHVDLLVCGATITAILQKLENIKMQQDHLDQNPELQIRALIADWKLAVEAKNILGITALYAPNIVAYDAILQLQFIGVDAYREHWQRCMEQCSGGSGWVKLTQLVVEANEQLAFSHALAEFGGTDDQGSTQSCWMRVTQCWRKIDGQWRVVHEHFSVPFDMVSGEALCSLQP